MCTFCPSKSSHTNCSFCWVDFHETDIEAMSLEASPNSYFLISHCLCYQRDGYSKSWSGWWSFAIKPLLMSLPRTDDVIARHGVIANKRILTREFLDGCPLNLVWTLCHWRLLQARTPFNFQHTITPAWRMLSFVWCSHLCHYPWSSATTWWRHRPHAHYNSRMAGLFLRKLCMDAMRPKSFLKCSKIWNTNVTDAQSREVGRWFSAMTPQLITATNDDVIARDSMCAKFLSKLFVLSSVSGHLNYLISYLSSPMLSSVGDHSNYSCCKLSVI
jgi:hypothetical protein